MGFLTRLFLGDGRLAPELKAELEAEGLVLIEEGMTGSVRYDHFKAPGKRFNGKVTGICAGLGMSEQRLVIYCHSGRVELADSPWSSPRWEAATVSQDGERIVIEVDYDRMPDSPKVSGQIAIRMNTPNAASIVDQLRSRLAKRPELS